MGRRGGLWTTILLAVSCSPAVSEPAGSSPAPDVSLPVPTASAPSAPPETPSFPVAAALEFSLDEARAGQGEVTFEDGGTVVTVAGDGAKFELVVPPRSVLEDTLITMTPLVGVKGVGDGPVHAVRLEPAGLTFFDFARLTVVPAVPIAAADQLMFQAAHDGTRVLAAFVDPAAEQIVILAPHFTILGAAKAAGQAQWLYAQSASALERLTHEASSTLQAERKRQLAGMEARPEVWDRILELFEQANTDVLGPLKEAALLECGGAQRYIDTLHSIEKVAHVVGLSADEFSETVQKEMASVFESAFVVCEAEAIRKCQAAKPPDPSILYLFWLAWNRQLTMQGLSERPIPADAEEKARAICSGGFAFEFSETVPSQATDREGNITTTGTVLGCVQEDGTWDFGGTYTVRFPDGTSYDDGEFFDLVGDQRPDNFVLVPWVAEEHWNTFGPPPADLRDRLTVTGALSQTPSATFVIYTSGLFGPPEVHMEANLTLIPKYPPQCPSPDG
jgi:hypothetical protein